MTFSEWLNQNYDEPGPLRIVSFLLECLAGTALMMLMLVTCFDVIGRYFFDSPIQGASEITEIGIALVVFSQMPKITWSGGHVVVDILDRFMKPVVIRLLGTFSAIIISASFYFLAVRIWELAARSIKRNETTEYLGFSVGIIVQYIAIMSWVTAAGVLTWGIIRLWTSNQKEQTQTVEG
ncbi:TRAP transporter small permease [Photobacterium minamisatsumaniensis]|uniref:TRAP transporter small permease n=1 Tax=Photobacterium minamisatsumaniensis TaxID=2910233 RepID=UPI003D0AF6AF